MDESSLATGKNSTNTFIKMNFSARRLFDGFRFMPINALNYLEDQIFARQNIKFLVPNAQVLATRSHYILPELRVLMNDTAGDEVKQHIKYVTVRMPPSKTDSSVLSFWLSFLKTIVVQLPPLPEGDWNRAKVVMDEVTQTYKVNGLSSEVLGEIPNAWHPLKIEYLDLKKIRKLKTESAVRGFHNADFLQVVTHPTFNDELVLMKIDSFPDNWGDSFLNNEITVYQEIQDLGIAPRFLGHVTEHGRVIGFLSEFLADATPASKVWTQETRRAYRESLRKLHSRGIAHKDAHWDNCLIRKNGSAVLIDFELSLIRPSDISQEDEPAIWKQFENLCEADLRRVVSEQGYRDGLHVSAIAILIRPFIVTLRIWTAIKERLSQWRTNRVLIL
ncbi:hypothetical protein GGS26DRAFT_586150 [Hypomontagnella submonticulosa]|nr:hypothetical protein GGS26DRAFT_586150 [Hypomontagnella submonticulosa]